MNKRIGDLEFRLNDDKRSPEIVGIIKREGKPETCYTLVFYERDKEGYNVHFVGSRPFSEEIDQDALWKLLRFGQTICDAVFKLEQQW